MRFDERPTSFRPHTSVCSVGSALPQCTTRAGVPRHRQNQSYPSKPMFDASGGTAYLSFITILRRPNVGCAPGYRLRDTTNIAQITQCATRAGVPHLAARLQQPVRTLFQPACGIAMTSNRISCTIGVGMAARDDYQNESQIDVFFVWAPLQPARGLLVVELVLSD